MEVSGKEGLRLCPWEGRGGGGEEEGEWGEVGWGGDGGGGKGGARAIQKKITVIISFSTKRPPDRHPGPKNGHGAALETLRTLFPLCCCPGFCVERRPPQAVQPQSGDLGFRF